MKLTVRTRELFLSVPEHLRELFDAEHPWEIIPRIRSCAEELVTGGLEGYTLLSDGVLVGRDVKIHPSATIIGPAVIGHGCEIRPGAYIRGSVIVADGCVIGNSTELKNCVLLEGCAAPHYNYIGDSVLGCKAHTGAGVILSNLKSDKGEITVHADKEYKTGLRKLGAILGDGADIGSGCVLNPGTVIGRGTSVYPLTCLRGSYPEGAIVKSTDVFVERLQ